MKCLLCGNNINDIITDTLRDGSNTNVYWCNNCELGFLDSKKHDMKEYYNSTYRKEYSPILNTETNPEELFNHHFKFQKDRLKLVEPLINSNSKLIEVGCSSGMFLYHLKDKVKELVGIDFDSKSANYTSKKCNCKTYTTEITETPLKEKYFDVICCFQTLEHTENPIEFINTLKRYLKPNGKIVIEVPNTYDVLIHTYKLKNHFKFYFHKAHLYYFTEKSLKTIFDISNIKGNFYYSQDYNIFNNINWLIHDAPQPKGNNGLDKPIVDVKNNSKEINDFFERINNDYKELLERLKISSNLIFVGEV